MNENERNSLFLKVSVVLTGFTDVELLGTGLVETYCGILKSKVDDDILDNFFKEAKQVLCKTGKALTSAINENLISEHKYDAIAKKIILMWYQGMWYPNMLKTPMPEIINAQAFVESLAWQAAKTHPSGAKQPGFGSWGKKPL